MNTQFLRRNAALIIILCIAAGLRLVHLGSIPAALSGDELLYPFTARAVALTGHDISGTWSPVSALWFRYPPGEHQAELPYFIHLFFGSLFPLSLFAAKLPFAVMSIGIVILIFKITEILLGTRAAFATGLTAAFSPWLITIGRTGYESTPAAFFYLLFLYLVLRLKARNIYWTFIPLVLGFYSYIGTKLNFLPYTAVSVWLAYETQKHRFRKQYLLLIGAAVCIVVSFFLLLRTGQGTSRMSEIFLPDSPSIATAVDALRQSSIQTPVLRLLVNKYTVYLQAVTVKLFRIFSPSYLFVEGDQIFLPVSQSFFHMVDSIFMVAGLLFLFAKSRRLAAAFLLLILTGTLPQIFHTSPGDFSMHLTLLFPFLIILTGYGIARTVDLFAQKFKLVILGVILILYAFNIGTFLNAYAFRYPLLGAGDFHMRILSDYIRRAAGNSEPITVYSTTSRDLLKKYLFYTDSLNRNTLPRIRSIFAGSPDIRLGNITFKSCDTTVKQISDSELLIYDAKCGMNIDGPRTQIVRLTDAGGIYNIYNDTFCSRFRLHPYPTGIRISDFNISSLSDERFCTSYFK